MRAIYVYTSEIHSEIVCGRMINSNASARMQLQAQFKFTPAMLINGRSYSFHIKYVNLYAYTYIEKYDASRHFHFYKSSTFRKLSLFIQMQFPCIL